MLRFEEMLNFFVWLEICTHRYILLGDTCVSNERKGTVTVHKNLQILTKPGLCHKLLVKWLRFGEEKRLNYFVWLEICTRRYILFGDTCVSSVRKGTVTVHKNLQILTKPGLCHKMLKLSKNSVYHGS